MTRSPRVRRAAVRLAVVEPRDDVLIREIPSNRSGQADVGQTALQFFGYGGVAKNVLIQHVSERNELGPVIEIRLFVNASRNFRLELRGIADLPYDVAPDDGESADGRAVMRPARQRKHLSRISACSRVFSFRPLRFRLLWIEPSTTASSTRS